MSTRKFTRRKYLKTTAAALAGTCLLSLTKKAAAKTDKPNFLWIIAEDISPFFGCYGDKDAHTPHIDKYAKKSIVFKRAFSTAPICAPSRSCLATGMYATSLGSQNLRSEVKIPERVQPLAKVFRSNGYWTSLRGKTDYNFAPDGFFDYWDQDTAPWQQCPQDKPFFSFINLGSTHEGSGNLAVKADQALTRLPQQYKHDPDKMTPPPYFPNTPEMRRIWARYYDLITVWDHDVNQVLQQLEKDGRADDTIVFLMADHGLGLPRYKRSLYLTGLNVPLVVHVPDKFKNLIQSKNANVRDDIVSYVDLPPTILQMAGISVPEKMQGKSLFDGDEREYIFGARDRADDMFDLSRAVFDGRYLYIRHFMPHMPPMQQGVIMSDYKKESHKELYRMHNAGKDTEQSAKLWSPRPFEELYDIQNDPQELTNIAGEKKLKRIKKKLAAKLREWILETRDSGFMTEPDMHRRAIETGTTPFDILQDEQTYPIEKIVKAAEMASEPGSKLLFAGDDPMQTFWAIQQRIIRKDKSNETVAFLQAQLQHVNPTVRTAAAEALARIGFEKFSYPVFADLLSETEPNLLLYIARSVAISLDDVRPIEKEVRAARERQLAPPGSPRPWKDFNYAAFTTWALEWALIKSGLNTPEDFGLTE